MSTISPVSFGTAPHWDNDTQTLYYVSVFSNTLIKYVDGKHFLSKLDGMPTFIIPIEGKQNHFAVSLDRKLVQVEWHGGDGEAKVIRTIAEVDQEHPDNRLSHGKADPRGRLFAGTVPANPNLNKKQGSLYRFEADGRPRRVLADIGGAKGLCWDLADKAFYFIDNLSYSIRRYDYDVETGDISNPQIVFAMDQDHEYILTKTEYFRHGDTHTDLDSMERYVAGLIEGEHKAGRQGDRQDYNDGGSQGFNQDDKFESHDVNEGGLLDYDQGGQEYVEGGPEDGRRGAYRVYAQDEKNPNDQQSESSNEQGGLQGHAPVGHQDSTPDGPQDSTPQGSQGYAPGGLQDSSPDGPQDTTPEGSQGYAPEGLQDSTPDGLQEYGPGGPQDNAPGGLQEYGRSGPKDNAPGGPQDSTLDGPQEYGPGGSKSLKKKLPGILDGMTIDTEGNLWVANYNGSQMLKIDPKKGKLLQVVRVGASLVTSATFGEPGLATLYVTTAATSSKGQQPQHSPAGATFSINFTGAKGHPDNKVRFNNSTTYTNGTKEDANKVLK